MTRRLVLVTPPFDRRLLPYVEGYLVDAMPDESVGVVDEVIIDDDGQPVALVVGCGWFGRRKYRINVDDIHDISPESRRLRVHRSARAIAAELRNH